MPTTSSKPTSPLGGSADPVSAIANALGELFKVVNVALQPGLISTQAYFQQLLNAAPKFQNPFAEIQQGQRNFNVTLLYGAIVVVIVLVVAIAVGGGGKK